MPLNGPFCTYMSHGSIRIEGAELGIDLKASGGELRIVAVARGGEGARRGLRAGDVLVGVNEMRSPDAWDLLEALRGAAATRPVTLHIARVVAERQRAASAGASSAVVSTASPGGGLETSGTSRWVHGQVDGKPTIFDAVTGKITTLPAPPVPPTARANAPRRALSGGPQRLGGFLRSAFDRVRRRNSPAERTYDPNNASCVCRGWLWTHGAPRGAAPRDKDGGAAGGERAEIELRRMYGALSFGGDASEKSAVLRLYDPPALSRARSRSGSADGADARSKARASAEWSKLRLAAVLPLASVLCFNLAEPTKHVALLRRRATGAASRYVVECVSAGSGALRDCGDEVNA